MIPLMKHLPKGAKLMMKPSARQVIEKQTAGVWIEETAGKHPLGALSPSPVVEEERCWQWAGTYRPGSLLVFLDLVVRCALLLYYVHYSLKPGNTTNSNLAVGYCQWQDISTGQVYHWSTCPSTTPPPRGHLYNCSASNEHFPLNEHTVNTYMCVIHALPRLCFLLWRIYDYSHSTMLRQLGLQIRTLPPLSQILIRTVRFWLDRG